MMFLSAFDDFDGVDSQIGKPCSSKSVSKVTQRGNTYCYNLWNDWVYTVQTQTGPLLHNITTKELQHWLCPFVLEVWKKDGNLFVPNTFPAA